VPDHGRQGVRAGRACCTVHFYIRTISVALNNLQTRTPFLGVSMDADTLSSEVEITAERSTALLHHTKIYCVSVLQLLITVI